MFVKCQLRCNALQLIRRQPSRKDAPSYRAPGSAARKSGARLRIRLNSSRDKRVTKTPQSQRAPLRRLHGVLARFFLLIAGALVTSNDAGLSVPDWPLSYGSLLPPMVGGIFYEHGHRMIAAFVGMLSIVLAVWLWRVESRSLGALARRRRAGRRDRAGHSRRHHRAVLPAAGDLLGARHPRAAFLLHRREHRPLHQRLVGAANAVQVARQPERPAIHALAIATACAVLVQLILGAAFRHKAFGIIPHLMGAVVVTGLIFWLAGELAAPLRRRPSIAYLRAASCTR